MKKDVFLEIKMKEYSSTKTIRDIYIYNYNRELCFSLEQTEKEPDLPQILREILGPEHGVIIKQFKSVHYPPGSTQKDKYVYEFFIFDGELKKLEPSKEIKINPPLQIPEEVEISLWHEDYRDWGGGIKTKAYLKQSLEEILGIKISFYKKKGEVYEYWTSSAQGEKLGELYTTGVLQDILKILGVKKIKIEEHERKYYHPTSSRLFNLKDWSQDRAYEASLEGWSIKNKYIVIQDENKLEIYVELEA